MSGESPTGTETTVHGLRTYVAQPAEGVTPKGIVVFVPDAFGWQFVNNRVLCDHYAQKGGLLVYLPDFMAGALREFGPQSDARSDSPLQTTQWTLVF